MKFFPFAMKAMLYSEKRFIEHAKNLKVVLFEEEIQFHSTHYIMYLHLREIHTTLSTFFALSSYKKFCEHVIICIKTFFNRSALEKVVSSTTLHTFLHVPPYILACEKKQNTVCRYLICIIYFP